MTQGTIRVPGIQASKEDAAMAPENHNAVEQEIERYEQDLADYLQERIKPGLNRGAIPLLSRSIAREVAHWETFGDASTNGDGQAEDDLEDEAEEEREEATDLETDLRELQSELGDDWTLSFSIHGDDTWLTAEKDD